MPKHRRWWLGAESVRTLTPVIMPLSLCPTRTVDRISYLDSTVFVDLTREAVEQSPAHHVSPFSAIA